MPLHCYVVNCRSNAKYVQKSFFRLPSVPTKAPDRIKKLIALRRKQWLSAIKRADITDAKAKYLRVCEDHFLTGKPAHVEDMNHPDWAPSQNLGYSKPNSASTYERYQRAQARMRFLGEEVEGSLAVGTDADNASTSSHNVTAQAHSSLELQAIDGLLAMGMEDDASTPNHELIAQSADEAIIPENAVSTQTDFPSFSEAFTQTDLTLQDLASLQQSNESLRSRFAKVDNKLKKMCLDEEDFAEDDEKTKYYSGLNTFQLLIIIFNIISPFLTVTSTSALSKFQQYILTLMHMRLNLDFTDLAYRFGISTQTASRTFHNCLWIMNGRLKSMILWPDRSALRANVPAAFLEAFGRKVTIIIDCFEIMIEKAPKVLAAAQTYSHYKHHSTAKYLIGICPQGVITFISPGWGGRVSDKFIVQNCGILEKLLPGDLILADRGFDVQDEVNLYCAEIKVPAFTKGKKQLSPFEVEKTRELAHVRIHVERVIGLLRQKYRILHNIVPMSLTKKSSADGSSTLDQIVTVCCCLVNLLPSVVPFD